MTQTQKT
jgi:hypothetical protein